MFNEKLNSSYQQMSTTSKWLDEKFIEHLLPVINQVHLGCIQGESITNGCNVQNFQENKNYRKKT